jgi:ligand-binding sensor domain-containing protein/signal transduction histidine kinase
MTTSRVWRTFLASIVAALMVVSSNGAEICEYNSRVWQFADGLPHVSVHVTAQTSDGYLWVGSRRGLARFDGAKFTELHDPLFPELDKASVNAMLATSDGSLWVGTARDGLFRYYRKKITKVPLPSQVNSTPILSLAESSDHVLWIGSGDGVFRSSRDDDYKKVEVLAEIPRTTVRAIHHEPPSKLWFGTSSGLYEFDQKILSHRSLTNGLKSNFIRTLLTDREGTLWCGSNQGLAQLRGNKITHFTQRHGLKDNTVSAVYQDRQGIIWIGTYGGLNRWENGKIVTELTPDGLPYDVIFSFLEDVEGNLWIGAKDGLHRLNPKRFKTITTREGLSHNNVMSLMEDKAGALWVGTWGGGITRIKEGESTNYFNAASNSMQIDLVLGLCESREGSIWIGTDYTHGLFRMQAGKFERFNEGKSFNPYAVRALLCDQKTNLWIAMSEGLAVYEDNKVRRFNKASGLPSQLIRALLEDRTGRIWVGTENGLVVADGDQFVPFPNDTPITDPVASFYEDADGSLWIGTLGSGLFRWSNNRLHRYTKEQGLFDDDVFDMVEDDHGRLWIACMKGFFHVRKSQFDEVGPGKDDAILNCVSYGSYEDTLRVQCNGVAKPSVIKRRDGTLAFASTKGVVVINPALDVRKNEVVPAVSIERLAAGETSYFDFADSADPPVQIEIPPGKSIEIHYTALSFRAPEKNRFKYKLSNIDDHWVDATGFQRVARYSRLPHGQYVFQVIASNNDGVWNEKGTQLSFIILPEFWQTWWFKLASISCVTVMAFGGYQLRVTRIKELERLRLRIAADLHDDVGAHLTKMTMLMEKASGEREDMSGRNSLLQEAIETSRHVMLAMDQIVWTIKPKNDTVENLANYIFRYSQRYCRNTGIKCILDIPANLPNEAIATEVRHQLFLAFKEALHNAVKHSQANEINVSFHYFDRVLSLAVADNGLGFTPQANSAGNGLANMKGRMERLRGEFRVESAPGKGARIELRARA